MSEKKLILKRNRTRSLERRHPWIFSGAVGKLEGDIAPGDLVSIYDHNGEPLGVGHYQKSSITVRILDFGVSELPDNFWKDRVFEAWNLRKGLGMPGHSTNIFRLIHGEGDQLPGLIVDVYGSTAVIQFHDLGMFNAREYIIEALRNLPGAPIKAIYNKSKDTLHSGAVDNDEGYIYGSPEDESYFENGIPFMINWKTGQKTGFFLDQRDNRALVEQYAAGKKVLNAFSYTGGFSMYALKGGADLVHSMDISEKALELAEGNVSLLGDQYVKRHKTIKADILKDLKNQKENYDLIILDPPAFAKRMSARHRAIQAYKRVNEAALRKLPKGGTLFTFSCSQVVTRPIFEYTILAAAINVQRPIRVLHRLSQGADHPSNIFHPESEYLKGLVVQVE